MQCHDLVWNSVEGLAGVLQHRALLAPPDAILHSW